MKLFWSTVSFLFSATLPLASSIDIDLNNEASIRSAAATYAHGLLSHYTNNQSNTLNTMIGTLPEPYYWWEAGAMWGGLIDYWAYTNDSTYVNATRQALIANFGPDKNLLLPWQAQDEGNDDQAFWALTLMSALETQFPTPNDSDPQYLNVAKGAFDNIASRWDTTSCAGGLKWQIDPGRSDGYDYKNSISNGAFFALAARLARYTGNQTYVDWAGKTWDWVRAVGMISDNYEVFDGTDDLKNCSEMNHIQWSYGVGVFMHGAANLYNYTNGSSIWQERLSGLLDRSAVFFSPYKNSTNIMYEAACEQVQTCDIDQQSFKAYLGRFMAKSAILAPYAAQSVSTFLKTSAQAAAKSCSGGTDGVTCGSKWYTGGWDGTSGVGQQLSALEVTQALLAAKAGAPSTEKNVHIVKPSVTSTLSLPVRSTSGEIQSPSSNAAVGHAFPTSQALTGAAVAGIIGGLWL